MSSNASDAVREVITWISAAWRYRRYDDLGPMCVEDMVFTLPGFSGRLEGPEAIVASYREFMERLNSATR